LFGLAAPSASQTGRSAGRPAPLTRHSRSLCFITRAFSSHKRLSVLLDALLAFATFTEDGVVAVVEQDAAIQR
jgi:hypothetical protein